MATSSSFFRRGCCWLFKRDALTDESRELLIFITPRILKDGLALRQ